MNPAWQVVLSAIAGGSATAFMVKLLITRSIRDLDRIAQKLERINGKIGVVESKLESMDRMKGLLFEHDRKIVEMETRYASGRFAPITS